MPDFDLALELLAGVAASWQEDRIPFWLFIQDQPGWSADLPQISLGYVGNGSTRVEFP